jgi:hypothetical protein
VSSQLTFHCKYIHVESLKRVCIFSPHLRYFNGFPVFRRNRHSQCKTSFYWHEISSSLLHFDLTMIRRIKTSPISRPVLILGAELGRQVRVDSIYQKLLETHAIFLCSNTDSWCVTINVEISMNDRRQCRIYSIYLSLLRYNVPLNLLPSSQLKFVSDWNDIVIQPISTIQNNGYI